MCVFVVVGLRTSLAVGAADLDGGQIVQELLEVGVAQCGPPGVVGAVVQPGGNGQEKTRSDNHQPTINVKNLHFVLLQA